MNDTQNILDFYKQTSCFTDLGLYTKFAKNLPDDIRELCLLQRHQIIHPVVIMKTQGATDTFSTFHGDMTRIPFDRLLFENERFPTALSILAELLRRENCYSINRKIENKMHLTCREQAILLCAILKAKGIPARVRSGYAPYITNDGISHDHWICERYDESTHRWILTDADCSVEPLDFDYADIPHEKFIFGAEAYLGIRSGKIRDEELVFASVPPTTGLRTAIQALFYDFHSLMGNEIFFWHSPRYIAEKGFVLGEDELRELDGLAKVMLDVDARFGELREIWKRERKYRVLSGGFN